MDNNEINDFPIKNLERGTIRELTDEEKLLPKCVENNYKWVVENEYRYTTNGHTITVPVGFLTDGSTGGPDVGCSWLFHDWLYSYHKYDDNVDCTREEADRIMAKILEMENRPFYYKVFTFVTSNNCCWCFSRSWREGGNKGPQYL